MNLWSTASYSGLNFANSSAERRGILLSNQISSILICLQSFLVPLYAYWYGWNVITAILPVFILLYLFPIFLNRRGYVNLSRMWLSLLVPVIVTALSIYSKTIYYEAQQELDYFTFRFVILASCVFPPILFSIRERKQLFGFLGTNLLILLAFDPLHIFFNVPYRKESLATSHYYFTNVLVFISFIMIAGTVLFLKWTSERFEEKNEMLIQDLNTTNEQLTEKNAEVEAQNLEIIAQSDNLNINQQKLTDAYNVIEEQRNLLFRQNKNLSSELLQKNKDLTETNAELIKHNNELRQFSYTVSHNLRGPVASVLGLIALIDQQNLQENDRDIFDHLKTSAYRLDAIINDLNKIIDIRHDIFQIRQKVNLKKEIHEITQVLHRDIVQYSVSIECTLDIEEIYSVQPMVHSILYNLISNAVKYRSPERQSVVTISSRENENYCILEVTDNGLGIDLQRNRENLFKLYKRFHYHTEGKGLGLYLVRLQAESLGGYVDVESEINRFTRFTVFLRKPENITRQILYQEPHADIFYDARINATGVVWRGPVTSHQYRTVFQKCLEFVKVYNTPNYIADISSQGPVERDDQHWMFTHILPDAARNGLRRIAAIRPDAADQLTKEYLVGINQTLSQLGVWQEFFTSMEEAVKWIQQENEKAALKFSENGKNH